MFRSRYSERLRVITPVGKISRAKQSFAAECDINNILKKYVKTGLLPIVAKSPSFDDFSDVVDYQSAMNVVLSAQGAFAELPSKVRARFGNDPANFMSFMANPDNADEAISLGLATRREPIVDGSDPAVLPPAKPVPPVTT